MITLQTRPIQVLCRADFWQASSLSSSVESWLHSCVASCLAGCCRRKQLPFAECLSTSSPSQASSKTGLVSTGLSRIATGSVVASPIERLTGNTKLGCRNHTEMAIMPEAIESFATSNSSMRFAVEGFPDSNNSTYLAGKEIEEEEEEEEEDGALMPYVVETGTKACLQPLPPHASSLPFSKQDAPSIASDNELRILEQEKQRRKKISEANKNRVPWNKGVKYKQEKRKNFGASTNKNTIVLDDSMEIIAKEKQRRQRIAAANLGKAAWNKGRQHSEETRLRIKERTIEAMKNPKIREKLRACGYTQSHETKSKISAGLVLMWQARKKLKQEQNNCEEEWKECVADVARMGHGGEDEYDWSSCDTILRDLKKSSRSKDLKKGSRSKDLKKRSEWRECVADVARMGHGVEDKYDWSSCDTILRDLKKSSRSKDLKKGSRSNHKRRIKGPRQPMTSTHRIKIANAIRTKWEDFRYRNSMEAARQTQWEKQGTGLVKDSRRLGTKKFHDTLIESRKLESDDDYAESDDDSIHSAESLPCIGSEFLQSMQKVLPAYRNPLNDQMLDNLKRIRARRRSKELSQSDTLERARILMAEAQIAARALEAQAAIDESKLPLLQEAQKLLAEAAESFKAAGLAADMFLKPSKGT